MRKAFAIALLLLAPCLCYAGNDSQDNGQYFVEGIAQYNEGDYASALKSLGVARDNVPSVADYALLYIARAYLHTGSSEKALDSARALYINYPDSPLLDDARGIEVVAALQKDEQGALWLLERYVDDYPSDMEMKFILASLLKEAGRIERAKPHLKDIYKAACPLSQDALGELGPADITAEDLIERGENLFKSRRYEDAEKALREALDKCDDSLRPGIKEKLADSLFRQRKYRESAELFVEVGDLYNAARSYIRDGQSAKFHDAMEKLVNSGEPKGANLMLAYAGDLRRKGKTKEALKLLKRVQKLYPYSSEEALWSTGWIHFVSGDYGKANKIFSKLHKKHMSEKYLYWKARAEEKLGKDSSELYKEIEKYEGFYGVLARLRTGRLNADAEKLEKTTNIKPEPIERVDLLVAAGLKDDASKELLLRAERKRDSRSLRDIAIRLLDLQQYRKAMLVTSTIPKDLRPFEVQYPMAFWSRVEAEAAENDMDPYLLLSLIREESRFDPNALSPAGAIGLMQLMPQTAKHTAQRLKVAVKGVESLQEVDLNIKLGSFYLSGLLKQFDSVPAALAAYNAGGSRVKTWLSQNDYGSSDEFIEDIPFEETRNYVKRIVRSYFYYWRARPLENKASLKIL